MGEAWVGKVVQGAITVGAGLCALIIAGIIFWGILDFRLTRALRKKIWE